VTPFSRFRSQPFGNTGGQHYTIRVRFSYHHANWREHAESKAIVTRMPCPYTLWFSRCWDVFKLRSPRYLNPVLTIACCGCLTS